MENCPWRPLRNLAISEVTTDEDEDVDYLLEKLPGIVETLRAMSPLYNSKKVG